MHAVRHRRQTSLREWALTILIPTALGLIGLFPLGLRGLWWGLAAACGVMVVLRLVTANSSHPRRSLVGDTPLLGLAFVCGAFLVLGFAWTAIDTTTAHDTAGQAAVRAVLVEVAEDQQIIDQAGSAEGLFDTPMSTTAFDTERGVLAQALPLGAYRVVAHFYSWVHDVLSQQQLLVSPNGQRNYGVLRALAEAAERALVSS
jgi:hypothetical protein